MCPEGVRDPPPWPAVLVVIQCIMFVGSNKHLLAAALLLIGYDAYLRSSDGLRLQRADVTLVSTRLARSAWVLTIAPQGGALAKNREHDCSITVGCGGRDWALALVAALYRRTAKDSDLLFGSLQLSEVEKFRRDAVKQLQLPIRVDPIRCDMVVRQQTCMPV